MMKLIQRDYIVIYKMKGFARHIYGKLQKCLNFPYSTAIVLLSCVYMTYDNMCLSIEIKCFMQQIKVTSKAQKKSSVMYIFHVLSLCPMFYSMGLGVSTGVLDNDQW